MTKILLVEDEDLFAVMIQKSLAASGYEVVRARNGKEALKLYEPQTMGLVLTDLIMPDMEGVELIVALRKAHPAVKIVAMSGGGRNQPATYLAIAQQVGAVKTLAKPFPLGELLQTVQECLDPRPTSAGTGSFIASRPPGGLGSLPSGSSSSAERFLGWLRIAVRWTRLNVPGHESHPFKVRSEGF